MRAIANWIFLIAMSFWLGSILFFSFVLGPTLKAELPANQFYETVNFLLPIYFQLGVVVGVIALLVAFVRTLRADQPKRLLKWVSALIIVMLALNVVGGYVLLPQLEELIPQALDTNNPNLEKYTSLYNYLQGISLLNLLLGLQVLLLISVDMRILPGRPSRGGGYSMRF